MSEVLLDMLRAKVQNVKRVSSTNGDEYHSPCPRCGGTDRFICFPNQDGGEIAKQYGVSGTWACPRHCGTQGDAITFLMEFDGLTFKDACKALKIELNSNFRAYKPLVPYTTQTKNNFIAKDYILPSDKWIQQATKMALEAHERLMATPLVLNYLAKRGLNTSAVKKYKLGYIEAEHEKGACIFRHRSAFGLKNKTNNIGKEVKVLRIPRGITIPFWNKNGQCLRLRIRKRNSDIQGKNESKYLLLAQPEPAYSKPMSLLPKNFTAALTTWLVVEAELDAMAVHYACCEQANMQVATLSVLTMLGKPDAETHNLLKQSPRILVALDFEENKPQATREAVLWWTKTYPQAKAFPVPKGKDPGEAFALGVDLAAWVATSSVFTLKAPKESMANLTDRLSGGTQEESKPKKAIISNQAYEATFYQCWTGDDVPSECDYSLKYLKSYIQSNMDNLAEILLPCPKRNWNWIYLTACTESKYKCYGHKYCLFAIVNKLILEIKNENILSNSLHA